MFGLKELDSWLFKGFSGIINLLVQRAVEGKTPMSQVNLARLASQAAALELACVRLEQHAEGDLAGEALDNRLVSGLTALVMTVAARATYGVQVQNREATQLLKKEATRLKEVLAGLEKSAERLKQPEQFGHSDREAGFSDRSAKLFDSKEDVQAYLRGYKPDK